MSFVINIQSVQSTPICTITLNKNATMGDVKKEIAKNKKSLLVERQSLRTELKGKDITNDTTLNNLNLQSGTTLFVKDLGPQIGWRTVYLLEYLGPPFVYAFFAWRPSFIYSHAEAPFTTAARIAFICWTIHYVKRIFESAFVHRFSHGTMPFRNLYKNCGYYWGFAAYVAVHVNHPLFTAPSMVQVIIGGIIFAFAELGNLSIHILLRDLRPSGSTVRKIPNATSNPLTKLYDFVSCPNYTYEFLAWLGYFLITNCLPALIFALAGMYQMTVWAIGKHKAYKKEFKDYPKQRKAIIPYVL